jgi:hypothetical protein
MTRKNICEAVVAYFLNFKHYDLVLHSEYGSGFINSSQYGSGPTKEKIALLRTRAAQLENSLVIHCGISKGEYTSRPRQLLQLLSFTNKMLTGKGSQTDAAL